MKADEKTARVRRPVKFTRVLLYVIVLILGLVVVIPFLYMLLTTLKTNADLIATPPKLIPSEWSLMSYKRAVEYAPLLSFLKNSLIVAVIQTVGAVFTSCVSAFGFARIRFWGRDKIFFIYIVSIAIPFTVLFIPTYIVIQNMGLVNSLAGLIIPGISFPLGTFWMRQFYMSVPLEYEHSGVIDGCNRFQIFMYIFFPMSTASVAALGIFAFMNSWNNYIWPLIIMKDIAKFTLPLGLTTYLVQQGMGVRPTWNTIMAATTIALVPVFLLFLGFKEYFVKGVTLSGIKM
jgi:multiple sugar transport system permease protein